MSPCPVTPPLRAPPPSTPHLAHPPSALRDKTVVVLPQSLPEEVDVRLGPHASLQLLHLLWWFVRAKKKKKNMKNREIVKT